MFRTLTVALLLLAACQQQDRATPSPVEKAESNVVAPASVPSLEGSWRVSAVTGDAAVAKLGMTAAFAGGTVKLATGCLQRGWTYTQERNSVAFSASPGASSNCGRAPSASEESAYAALESANIAVFGKDGAQADLSGTGGTLTLERR
jgi:hypothetical protein